MSDRLAVARTPLAFFLPAYLFAFGTLAMGQARPGMPTTTPTQIAPQGPAPNGFGNPFGSVTVIVVDENGADLGEQALVKLASDTTSSNVWGTTQDRSQIIFDQVPLADYEVEVSAAGFETTTKQVTVMTAQAYQLIVRLKRDDSGAVTNPAPGQLLAPKARKEVQKGITALNAANLNDAQKHLESAYKLAPGNADVAFLMALLYMRRKDSSQAESYLDKALSINPKHLRALTTLGQVRLQEKNYAAAVDPLERATTVDSGYWVAHSMLADAYLRTGDFEKARQQAELAIQKGKGAAIGSELVLGEALASLGRRDEAVQAFQAFLQQSPGNQAAPVVREMIARLQSRSEPEYKQTSSSMAPVPMPTPQLAVMEGGLSIPTWHPANVDDEKPLLASGTVCPASEVIAGTGKRVKELVDNIGRFEATERVLHEELDPTGKPSAAENRKFDYIASISEVNGRLAVDEYRAGLTDQADFPDHITTLGLPALALAFHPLLRDDYQMTCEGLGRWQGRATWLVYFRQRPDKPSRLMSYAFTNASYSVPLKGRAWIAGDTFQIVHLEADLLSPMPSIRLLAQHQAVDYGPVHFSKRNTELWLPESADLYFDFRHHRYHRKHSFENYRLFSVGASQKISEPKTPDTPKVETSERQP